MSKVKEAFPRYTGNYIERLLQEFKANKGRAARTPAIPPAIPCGPGIVTPVDHKLHGGSIGKSLPDGCELINACVVQVIDWDAARTC